MRNPKIEFDELQLYFGEPYTVNVGESENKIKCLQPTIGKIVRMGEKKFYQTLNIFITNTTSYRLPLWRMGKDWNVMSDYELFINLLPMAEQPVLDLLFEDFKMDNLTLHKYELEDGTSSVVIYDTKNEVYFDETVYHHVSQYFRNVFNTFPEEKFTDQAIMKKWFIRKDENEERNNATKKENGTYKEGSIQAVISACVNHPGFKYDVRQLMDVGVCEFYDSVQRLQVYENTTALLKGMYGGFLDTSKLSKNPDTYNFMKSIK